MPASGPYIIAVDGPAGSGKSSICAAACRELGWSYINTGAIYRVFGLLAAERDVSCDDESQVAKLIEKEKSRVRWNGDTAQMFVDDRDVTAALGQDDVGGLASKIARLPAVRAALLPIQRDWTLLAHRGALVDGRDIATVVFPNADVKIFLTASLAARTQRRASQLNDTKDTSRIAEAIKQRDAQDSGRDVAPLKQADEAILVDTSELDFAESVAAVVSIIRERLNI